MVLRNGNMEIGRQDVAIDIHSSGAGRDYDVRFGSSGGGGQDSRGTFYINGDAAIFIEQFFMDGTAFRPFRNGSNQLGAAEYRWSTVFAATGTINTSDARKKNEVRGLSGAELSAAKQVSLEIGAYKFLSAMEEKGDDAREHISMTVQCAIEVMETNGLDPDGYGFICYKKWEATDSAFLDNDDVLIFGNNAGQIYSFRMDELLAFIVHGFK